LFSDNYVVSKIIVSIKNKEMRFQTRKLVSPPDLNPARALFGGQLLRWIDEEVAIYAMDIFKN
jgi:acyl-CoA hydrolase